MEQQELYLPLREEVFQTLRKEILEGSLKPGMRLMELHLADRLGVSRTPIREAIRMLEKEGLVTMVPRRGAFVAEINENQLIDVLEVRRAMEELAAELAAKRIKEEQLLELEEASRRFAEQTKSGSSNDMARADEDFHYMILEATDNQKLIQLLTGFREQIYRYRAAYLQQVSVYDELLEEHSRILECLREKDADKAVQAMREHIDRQQEFMLETVREK